MTVLFRLLGRVRVEVGGTVVEIPSAPVRGVLGTLLLEEGGSVSVDKLLLALWDVPPKSATSNLRLYIARLRAHLRQADPVLGERLVTLRGNGGGGYGLLADPDEIDSCLFKRLARRGADEMRDGTYPDAEQTLTAALRLWQGPIGVDCTASAPLRSRFDALNELRVAVREQLVETKLRLGHSYDLLPEIHEILSDWPCRELSWSQLIRAHYLGGDVAGACQAWGRASTALQDELGLDLSPDLRRLHISLLRRDDSAIRQAMSTADR